MEDYWLGVCVGWLIGCAVMWWLYRDLVKSLRKQVATLEKHIREFT